MATMVAFLLGIATFRIEFKPDKHDLSSMLYLAISGLCLLTIVQAVARFIIKVCLAVILKRTCEGVPKMRKHAVAAYEFCLPIVFSILHGLLISTAVPAALR
eukprot:CAMPEP_0184495308 /NCGR_PEP_ID=MMETSP0113_2-20130426/30921_1 /TAXON_ID=91329 /ORGANISM="Norrisiella sphaerica, Strain BC52" /LENGTH=101 /DNA_ID=CAMNT_0026881437 /DNA_START=80 /DNA_END=381 /DNA_ORIENTATION=+